MMKQWLRWRWPQLDSAYSAVVDRRNSSQVTVSSLAVCPNHEAAGRVPVSDGFLRLGAVGRLFLQHSRDPVLLDAVLVERCGGRVGTLRDGQLEALAVTPDGTAVQQMPDLAAEAADQRGRRLEREADQVDDDVGLQSR